MPFSGIFYMNSTPVQEHDFLAAPSDLELQQVSGAAFPPMCVAGGAGAHVSSSNLTLPVISNETLHLPSNSAPPELATQQLSNSASKVLPAESGGVTVPTAETTADEVDVENGVEVLSTLQESFVGMSFNSSDAAKDYYNSYARHTGFSIRIDTSRESKKANEKTKCIYVCQKAGVKKKRRLLMMGQ